MKRFASFILCCCLLCLCLLAASPSAFAATVVASGTCGAEGNDITWSLNSEGTLTISGAGAMADWLTANDTPWYTWRTTVTAVEVAEGITHIGDSSFLACTALDSVALPASLTSIGSGAFAKCTGLTALEIPETVTEIGFSAFSECRKLTGIQLPAGIQTIERYLLAYCSQLTDITIPASVTTINNNAFSGCSSLENVVFEGSAPQIDETAFTSVAATMQYTVDDSWTEDKKQNYGGTLTWEGVATEIASGTCGSYVTWKLMSDGMMTVSGTGAMKDYSYGIPWASVRNKIVHLVVEEGVTSIGQCTFDGSKNLKTVSLPSTLTSIKMQAFNGCTSLEQINFPASLGTVSTYAFMNCDSLTEVILPEGVTTIGHMAFALCDELTYVEIPSTVHNIAATVNDLGASLPFLSCPKLKEIWVDANSSYYCSDEKGVLYNKTMTKLIEAPGALEGGYTVPDTVKQIGLNAFQGCNLVTGISIPASVTTIGSGALSGCDAMEAIAVAEENTVYASEQGILLTKDKTTVLRVPGGFSGIYTAPETVTVLSEGSFSACKKLTGVELHAGIANLGKSVFANCSGLKEIALPEGHTSIGERCFINCTGLTNIVFPETLTSIDANAFASCTGLKAIDFPQSLTHIGNYAFEDCTGLSKVVFPQKMTRLGYMAFAGCTGLEEIQFSGKYPSASGYTESAAFSGVEADAYYPEGGSGWTETAMDNMSGTITWHSYRTCGKNLTWAFDEATGTLTISGTGPMYTYGRNNSGNGGTCDWESLKEKVYKVVIEEGVTTIADYAFYSFDNLAVMVLPSSLESVGQACCYVNDGLHHVLYSGTKEQWDAIKIGYSNSALTSSVRHYEAEADTVAITIKSSCSLASISDCAICRTSFYAGHTGEHTYTDGICTACGSSDLWVYQVIRSGVAITAYNGTEVVELVIPSAFEEVPVSTIGYAAFQNNLNLTGHLSLPASLQSVGQSAFSGCRNITSVDVPATLVRCYSGAFSGCTGLSGVYITDLTAWCGITFADKSASPLYHGKKLYLNDELVTKLEIPQGVAALKDYAFALYSDNKVFTEIVIPESVESIGADAFYNCRSVKTITFAGNAPVIADRAFYRVTANAWYPENDLTWTEDLLKNYGGTLTWNKLHTHVEEILSAQQPNCTETGLTEGLQCTACGEILTAQQEIPALGHTETEIPAVEGSCTESGFEAGVKCSVCQAILIEPEEILPVGHMERELPPAEPTCTKTGLTAGSICMACGETVVAQQELPAAGHAEVEIPAIVGNCTENSWTAGSKCTVCQEVITVPEEIAALGHSSKDGDHLCDACGLDLFEVHCTDGQLILQNIPADLLILMAGYTDGQMTFAEFLEVSGQIELPEAEEQICIFFLSGTTYAPYRIAIR